MKTFRERITPYLSLKSLISICTILLAAILLVSSVIFASKGVEDSTAYLYDEQSVTVNYNVAQLSFDLYSNHMYTYYTNDATYTTVDIADTKFEDILTSLNTLVGNVDAGTLSIADYDIAAKAVLDDYYATSLLAELQAAWDNNNTSQENYNDATIAVYNKYYTYYEYLFKIKDFQIASVDDNRSIWYYYAKDLIQTYFDEYIVQEPAMGVSQSTMRIGVKLKGGTTYSVDPNVTYYDTLFNDMVTAFTMTFKNTGNVNLYLNLGIELAQEANRNKGILCMLLPYGTTWASLVENETYNIFYNATTHKWNYRGLICELIKTREAQYVSAYTYSDANNKFGTLDYASTQALLEEWNAYAVTTYDVNDNANGNTIVYPYDEGDTSGNLMNIDMSMLFWADYGKCNENYATETDGGEWKKDDLYKIYHYDFVIDAKTSLKNSDMSVYTPADWNEMFNEEVEYEKFAGVSNFDVEGYAYFEQDNGDGTYTVTNAKNYVNGGYIEVNYIDSTQINYLFNLRFDVRYRGFSPAYIRVRLIEQFTNAGDEIVAVNRLQFKLADDWVDNRLDDLYFYSDQIYFSTDRTSVTTTGKARPILIPVIDGIIDGVTTAGDIDVILANDRTMKLKLIFLVDAVQPNRTEAYWGLTVDEINEICHPAIP